MKLKLTIQLKEKDACELIREGLAARGMVVDGDSDTSILIKPSENGDGFTVEVRDVLVSPPAPKPVPQLAPPESTGDVRELPDDDEPAAKPKTPPPRLKLKKAPEPPAAREEEEEVDVKKLMRESSSILSEQRKANRDKPDPRADGVALGARVFKSFDEIGVDPAVVSQEELYPGPNPQAGR